MAKLLGIEAFGSVSKMQVTLVDVPGPSSSSLGGVLGRSNKILTGGFRAKSSACKFRGRIYAVTANNTNGNKARVYRFIQDTLTNKVRKLILTGNPTLAVAAGETVTGPGGSPAIATVAEDYQTGDLYVITTEGNGVDFQNNDAITFSGGATATIAASAAVEDNGGEWIEVFQSTLSAGTTFVASGLWNFVTSAGEPGLAFVFNASSVGVILIRTTDGDTWSETTIGTVLSNPVSDSCFLNGAVYSSIDTGGQFNYLSVTSLDTASYTTAIMMNFSSATTACYGLFTAFNHVFASIFVTSFGTPYGYLKLVTGGVVTDIVNFASGVDRAPTVFYKGVNEEAIYVGRVVSGKLTLHRIAIINGVPVFNGHSTGSVTIGDKMLLGSLLAGQPQFWGKELEEYETSPGVKTSRILISSGTTVFNASSTVQEYSVGDAWQSLSGGVAYTWNGTIGNADDVVAITGHGIVVGDYLLHVVSNKVFKVAAVSGNNIQLENFSGAGLLPIPSTPSETRKAIQSWSLIGGTATNVAVPYGTRAGERMFTPGEITGYITTTEGKLGYEEISFELFNGDDSPVSCKVSVIYEGTDGTVTQGTLTNPSVGSIVANENVGLTCDDGATTYTVRSSLPPSGFKDRSLIVTAT